MRQPIQDTRTVLSRRQLLVLRLALRLHALPQGPADIDSTFTWRMTHISISPGGLACAQAQLHHLLLLRTDTDRQTVCMPRIAAHTWRGTTFMP